MEVDELITAWQANNDKLNEAVKLNVKTVDLILSQKAKSALKSVLIQRIIEISFHALALVLLLIFLAYNVNQLPYAISAIALIIFYTFLFLHCLKQIQLIKTVDSNTTILAKQQSLLKIQMHLLLFTRLSVLFIPALLSFAPIVSKACADLNLQLFGNFDILNQSNGMWWNIQLITYLVLIPIGIWFYNMVTVKNMHKPWVAHIIKRSSSKRVTKAIEYLNELNELNPR
ncbi:MAG TPA: hypothetical protein PLA68_00180 [Panacibacter sp.]|nr:hypothetical protein [Panacibacter sp.]